MIMDAMKDRSRITKEMEKVSKTIFFICWLFFMLCFIGEYFSNDGERYEGEWKDDKSHGQGKKEVFYFRINRF